MAIIKDILGYILKIDQTSQAARATLYNTDGTLVKAIDGVSKTYSASVTALVVAAAATDFLTITGSATKTRNKRYSNGGGSSKHKYYKKNYFKRGRHF